MIRPVALLSLGWMSPDWLLSHFGQEFFWIGALIVFIECGLLFPILPGDTLLFAAGLFIRTGELHYSLWFALLVFTIAAFAGNVVGYEIGRRVGHRVFQRNSRFLNMENFKKSHAFFERYGNRALILGRFVPIVRTFITLVAGAAEMGRHRFWLWSGVGAVVWVFLVTLIGHALGNVGFLRDNIEAVLILFVVVTTIPMVWEWRRKQGQQKRAPKA